MRQCELVSNIEHLDLEYIKEKLESLATNGKSVTDYAYIVHDKDTYEKDGKTSDGKNFKKKEI